MTYQVTNLTRSTLEVGGVILKGSETRPVPDSGKLDVESFFARGLVSYVATPDVPAASLTTDQVGKIQAQVSGYGISYPEHLAHTKLALAQANFRQCNITVCGNSITAGYFANDTSSTDWPVFRERGYAGQLRKRLESVYGTVGEGVILCNDSRVTYSGAQSIGSTGITMAGGLRISNTGQTVTLVTQACTDVWVHGWWESDAKCAAFRYTVDGGSTQTASISALGNDADYTVKITGLANTTHTIVILPASTATKQIDIAGFSVFGADTIRGVVVNRMGEGGGYVDTMFFPMSNTGAQPRSNRLTFGRTQTDLAILAFGANESSQTGEGISWTPDRYRTALLDVVTYLTDTYGCDVLLASLVRQNPSQVSSLTEQAFYSIHEEIAAANPRVAHWDLSRNARWATYSAADDAGLLHDNVHPGLAGHSDIASLLSRVITALA